MHLVPLNACSLEPPLALLQPPSASSPPLSLFPGALAWPWRLEVCCKHLLIVVLGVQHKQLFCVMGQQQALRYYLGAPLSCLTV